jgi:hypothetical protein
MTVNQIAKKAIVCYFLYGSICKYSIQGDTIAMNVGDERKSHCPLSLQV